jgi:hypothetical protein
VEISIRNLTLGRRTLELEVKKKAQTAQSFGAFDLQRLPVISA